MAYFVTHLSIPIIAVVLVTTAIAISRALLSPLRSVPGPLLARFTDAWYFWRVRQAHFEQDNQVLHEKYGSVIRYGPNRYSISDAHAAKTIYGHGTQFAKSSWYAAWVTPGTWSLFSDSSIKRHAQTRRLFQNDYSMTALVSYEPYVDECAALFSQRLGEFAAAQSPIDMGHWFQCYAFDVIGLITYGSRLGFLDSGDDIGGVLQALDSHLHYATLAGIYASLHGVLFKVRNYLAGAKGAGRAYILRFTLERIAAHKALPKPMPDQEDARNEPFLSKSLARHAADPENFEPRQITAGCMQNMTAGSDTTAITLSATLYHLLKNLACMSRLQQEVDDFTSEGKLSEFPTFKESQQMPYLQAVLKEALRIHPATGLPMERVVPEGGATISGRFFPEGTIVGINSWVEHRNRAIFGEDADSFRPERWLDEDSGRIALMNRHWIPFGLGSRTCIGRHISMLEISKLIPRLIRDFDFRLAGDFAEPGRSWETENFWFVKPRDFMVSISRRGSAGKS